MKYIPWIIMISYLSYSLTAKATFLPQNNLHLHPRPLGKVNISEELFNDILNQIEKIYAPIILTHGAIFTINRNWNSAIVNGGAEQIGIQWIINIYGGLARRPEITQDGFAVIVCHELGHHLGGFYFYGPNSEWASIEGQADYFSTQACLPKLWESDINENKGFRSSVDSIVKARCDSVWKNSDRQNLCYRIAAAGKSMATIFAALDSIAIPRFETPDQTQVAITRRSHPTPQCRLDTFLSGSLCIKHFNFNEIPGRNLSEGQNSISAELKSTESSCHDKDDFRFGSRPHCWFKPNL